MRADQLNLATGGEVEGLLAEPLMLSDGRQTLVLYHRPPQPAGPAVLYLHGIQSHPGWFAGSASALAQAGCEVFQVTRRGSGLDARGRGDAASASQLLEDVHSAVEYVRRRSPAAAPALVGVSWGGKLLTAYALLAGEKVASLTLVAPGIVPRVDLPAGRKLAIAAARLVCPGRRFDIPLNDVSLFTDNPAMREYLRQDPHRLHRATARFLVASAQLDRIIRRAPPGALTVPTTLLLAGRDRIIDNQATRAVLERLTGGRVRTFLLDAAHTLEFEPDPRRFYESLVRAVMKPPGRADGLPGRT